MTAHLVLPGLYRVPCGAVNVYLIDAPDGLTLIDAGFPDSAPTILSAISGLGRAPADLRAIVLTHAHPDHIGSLATLQRATGARSYMHALDIPIATAGGGFRPMTAAPGLLPGLLFRLFAGRVKTVEPATIDQPIADGELLPLAGGLRVIHTPGHCAGHVALMWDTGDALLAGDACSHLMGLGPPICYEDRAEGERSQKRLAGLPFEAACFGHGKPIVHNAAIKFRKAFG